MATNAGRRPANSPSAASSADADSAERGGHSSKETKRPAPIRSETVATRAAYCGGGRRSRASEGTRRGRSSPNPFRSMEGGSVDELLDVPVERPALDQL